MADEIKNEEIEEVELDEETKDDLENETTETSGEEEAENIEEEVEANDEIVGNLLEPETSTEHSDTPIGIIIDESLGGEGTEVTVEEELGDTTSEEDGEQMVAEGESFIAMAEENMADNLASDAEITHSDAREELGIVKTEVEGDDATPVSDAIVNETYISTPDEDGNIVVENYDENKAPDDYEAASNDPFKDDEDKLLDTEDLSGEGNGDSDAIPVSESFFLNGRGRK